MIRKLRRTNSYTIRKFCSDYAIDHVIPRSFGEIPIKMRYKSMYVNNIKSLSDIMFVYKTGNILRSKAEYIFNAVNTVGIMGKGLALQIKQKYPDCLKDYEEACRDKRLKPESVLITYLVKEKINIVQFPTKAHWRDPSKYEYIEEGLKSFTIFLKNHNIQNVTIAIPKLGCGNGKLEWKQVLTLIKQYLSEFDDIVFEIYGEDV